MNIVRCLPVAALVGVLGIAFRGTAAEPELRVGDPAPPLRTGRWIQGEPVKALEKGKVYVVEFWATWCGPCRDSIPHLNDLHRQFKDRGVIVIGQDCWESDESRAERFVKEMGGRMTYRVALDDRLGSEKGMMAETWMDAARQDGLPTAFVVDSASRVVWIGHPLELKPTILEAVLDGTHDLEKAKADFRQALKDSEAWKIVQFHKALVRDALRKQDWTAAEARLAEAEKALEPADLQALRIDWSLARRDFATVERLADRHFGPGRGAGARAVSVLNEIAWRMATDPELSAADLRRAETMARWADQAGGHRDPPVLDTLARILFRLDRRPEAIAVQERAASLDADPHYRKTLRSYLDGVLPPP